MDDKQRLYILLQWVLMGHDIYVLNVLMHTGENFFKKGETEIAVDFFREASRLKPNSGIFYIREAQCQIKLVSLS